MAANTLVFLVGSPSTMAALFTTFVVVFLVFVVALLFGATLSAASFDAVFLVSSATIRVTVVLVAAVFFAAGFLAFVAKVLLSQIK